MKRAKLDKLAVLERLSPMWSGDFVTDQTKERRMIQFFLCTQ